MGVTRGAGTREEAELERARTEKARALLEARLQKEARPLFRPPPEAARPAAVEAVQKKSVRNAEIEARLEEARREAEEAREARRAEAVIAGKLIEKEQRAREKASEAKKRARVEERTARERREFEDTKAALELAAQQRQQRREAREQIEQQPKTKPERLGEEALTRARAEYRRQAEDRAEAAAAAAAARAALPKPAPKPRPSAAVAPPQERGPVVKTSRPVASMSTRERAARRAALEALATVGDGASFDALRALTARAAAMGLADDCPELLEARVREHDLGARAAERTADKSAGELVFAKEQHAALADQGFHRAVEKAQRRIDAAWQKTTEARGAVQYHRARAAEARRLLARELQVRADAERPASMLAEEMASIDDSRPETIDEKPRDLSGRSRKAASATRRRAETETRRRVAALALAERRSREDVEARAAEAKRRAETETRAREKRLIEARAAAAERAARRADEEAERTREVARRADLRADAIAAAAAAAEAAQRLRTLDKKNAPPPRARSTEELKQSARQRRAAAHIARSLAHDLTNLNDPDKLALHFVHPETDDRNLSLKLGIPPAWHARPAAKLISVFSATYSSRKEPYCLPPTVTLETIDGATVAQDLCVRDVLDLAQGCLRVVSA